MVLVMNPSTLIKLFDRKKVWDYFCFKHVMLSDIKNDIKATAHNNIPSNLKSADVTPVFKRKGSFDKTNYRPVSILPPVSKIIEKESRNK